MKLFDENMNEIFIYEYSEGSEAGISYLNHFYLDREITDEELEYAKLEHEELTKKYYKDYEDASEKMKEYITEWLKKFDLISTIKRNKRDNIYSFTIVNEKAQEVVKYLYDNSTIHLPRKKLIAKQILEWERPENLKKITWNRSKWSESEIILIKKYNFNALKIFNKNIFPERTFKSINVKCYRLKNPDKYQ